MLTKKGAREEKGKAEQEPSMLGQGWVLGDIKGRKLGGSKRRLAARKRVAVVKVIANATAKRI